MKVFIKNKIGFTMLPAAQRGRLINHYEKSRNGFNFKSCIIIKFILPLQKLFV